MYYRHDVIDRQSRPTSQLYPSMAAKNEWKRCSKADRDDLKTGKSEWAALPCLARLHVRKCGAITRWSSLFAGMTYNDSFTNFSKPHCVAPNELCWPV